MVEYNLASQVVKTTAGYGTDVASVTETMYEPNGNVSDLKDGEGNTTHYTYDNFDRPLHQFFSQCYGRRVEHHRLSA